MAAAPEGVAAALSTLGEQTWEGQEACYGIVFKFLEFVVKAPGEPKFRSVNRWSAAIKTNVLDCPGGAGQFAFRLTRISPIPEST